MWLNSELGVQQDFERFDISKCQIIDRVWMDLFDSAVTGIIGNCHSRGMLRTKVVEGLPDI